MAKKAKKRSRGFLAVEMDLDTGKPTGRREIYLARNAKEAGKSLLHTRRLTDGGCRLGPTGLVVTCGSRVWVTLPKKPQR
jgi:hypothetical protein